MNENIDSSTEYRVAHRSISLDLLQNILKRIF